MSCELLVETLSSRFSVDVGIHRFLESVKRSGKIVKDRDAIWVESDYKSV